MFNIIRYITLSLHNIIKYTNQLSLRKYDFVSINKLKLLLLYVGVEVKLFKYSDFFCLRWVELRCLSPYMRLLTLAQKTR